LCIRWYAAYPLSLRSLPVRALTFYQRALPVGKSWRVDATYVLVGGQ
jgi:transposase-like protein